MNRIATGYHVGAQSVRHQKAMTKLDFFRTKILMRLLVLIAFVVGLSLFYIWSRVQIVQMGYEINEIKREQQILLDRNKQYRMELTYLKQPQRVQQYAEENLGMGMPSSESIVEIQ